MGFNRVKIILISLVLFIGLVWAAILHLPDEQLHLVFCDVGEGDSILIFRGKTQILIDGGPNQAVLTCLSHHLPFYDREIEMIVATHPDADHITGLIDVIERYDVKQFVLNSVGKDSGVYQKFKEAVLAEESPIFFPEEGDEVDLASIKLQVLWPSSQAKVLGTTTMAGEVNETSVVLQLSYGDFDVLLPADISSQVESQLDLKDVEVLKVAHHGSRYSTSDDFLLKITPELAVISVGKNSFGHPTKEVLNKLTGLGIKTMRTDEEGEIEVISDGMKWGIR
jgi:competence protein ComEC